MSIELNRIATIIADSKPDKIGTSALAIEHDLPNGQMLYVYGLVRHHTTQDEYIKHHYDFDISECYISDELNDEVWKATKYELYQIERMIDE